MKSYYLDGSNIAGGKRMKILAGIVFVVGIVLAAYFGLYICLVGGIADIVGQINNAIQHLPLDGMVIGVGVLKVMLTGVITGATFWLCAILAGVMASVD